jgi:hypothetical protein
METDASNHDKVAIDPELNPADAGVSLSGPGKDGIVDDAETDPDRRDLRSEIGKFVSLARFPATAGDLVAVAVANTAPDSVLEPLRGLEASAEFETTRDLWYALGLETKERF